MINYYWRIAYRHFSKQKLHTLINIAGLAVAAASSIIIFLYARYELSFDSIHANADNIYMVYKERSTSSGIQDVEDTWLPLLRHMKNRYSSILDGVRTLDATTRWLTIDGKKYQENVIYADPSIFDVFTFPLALGDESQVLAGRNSMVLSEDMAKKYFGEKNPIGKTITVNFTENYIITGVMKPIPSNSTLRPDFVVPLISMAEPAKFQEMDNSWSRSFLRTYILLDPQTAPTQIQSQFPALVESLFGQEGANGAQNMRLKLLAMRSLHDRATNSRNTAFVLLFIALCIIVVASVNFTNLAIARSMERAKEVGVRKTLGGTRSQLAIQFLFESFTVSFVGVTLGIGLTEMLLPIFNRTFVINLDLKLVSDFQLIVIMLLVWLFSALISGAYPALVLSRFNTAAALKGMVKSGVSGIWLRNGLIFLQFVSAILLVCGMLSIAQQIHYMKSKELHFRPSQVLAIPIGVDDLEPSSGSALRLETFKNELTRIPGVASIASSTSVPGRYEDSNVFIRPEGWDQPQPLRMRIAAVDENYFDLYEMEFTEGENFGASGPPIARSVIINEKAMHDMGWNSAVGKKVNDRTIVGVVKDFHFESLEREISAIVHAYLPGNSGSHRIISVKLSTDDIPTTIAKIEAVWNSFDSNRAFHYYFIDDQFDSLYRDVEKIGTLITYFSLLSIVIANLGLLGLISYAVIQRTKEIGIRKVFGAKINDIALFLVKGFVKPVVLANFIAWPAAYISINAWLENFPYRISISPLTFLLAGLLILLGAFLTALAQSLKTANLNPVDALRYE